MRRVFCTLAMLTFVNWSMLAQSTLFQETVTMSSEINGENRYDNELLDVVFSDGGDRLLTYKLDVASKITHIGGEMLVTIDNKKLTVGEEHKYKGFSINQVLVPGLFDAEFVLLSASDKELKRWTVENEHFEQGRNMVRYYYDGDLESGCKLRIVNVNLHFSKSGAREAEEFIGLIDNYFNTDARLNMMEQELDAVRTDSLELLEQFHQQTIDNVAIFNNIKSAHYSTKLDLANYDPINLESHVSRAEQLNRNVKKKVEYTLNHMWEAYYAKGMDCINWGMPDKAESMFIKSVEAKSNYAPPHYQLALMDFDAKLYNNVLDTCARIVVDMNPDSDTRYNTIKLAERVMYIFIDSVNGFIERQDVEGGFRMLTECKEYCKRIKGIRIFEEMDQLAAKLYGTIHSKLIKQAQAYFDEKNLKQSLVYADSAAQLRAEYPNFDIDSKAEDKLLNDLYVAWVEYGKSVAETQPEEALYAYDQATAICRKYSSVTCSDELEKLAFESRSNKYSQLLSVVGAVIAEEYADSALVLLDEAEAYRQNWELKKLPLADELHISAYQVKYNCLMREGDGALNRKSPREALAFYSSAMTISKTEHIVADTAWVTKNKKASVMYVVQLCSLGISYANALQMGNAGQQYQLALAVADKGMVTKDKEVQNALAELSAALNDGECSMAWFDYNVQVGSAERLIKQKEFIKARTSLSKAAGIARANYKCNLTDSVVQKRSDDIEAICEYQQMLNSVQPLLEQKEFQKALETYVSATEFFADSCKNKFGIKHKPIYDYVFENQYSGLIDAAVIYYAEINELKKSLKLLDELYRRYYESMWTRDSQSKLGIELARRDFRRHPGADPKVKVLDYTRGDKWYNNLKKAYLQEWIDNSTESLKETK